MNAQTPVFELRDEDELSLDLIEAQYALRESRDQKNAKSVLVLVSGIELAEKVKPLNNCENGWTLVICE